MTPEQAALLESQMEELVEPSPERREQCRMMAMYAPDVQSGDEEEYDVFEYFLEDFRSHGREAIRRAIKVLEKT